jgi:hypothetical protein
MQQEFRLADILLGGLWVGVLTLFCLPIMEMTVKKVTMERDELVKKLEEKEKGIVKRCMTGLGM